MKGTKAVTKLIRPLLQPSFLVNFQLLQPHSILVEPPGLLIRPLGNWCEQSDVEKEEDQG
jgi:hypothetical protein